MLILLSLTMNKIACSERHSVQNTSDKSIIPMTTARREFSCDDSNRSSLRMADEQISHRNIAPQLKYSYLINLYHEIKKHAQKHCNEYQTI